MDGRAERPWALQRALLGIQPHIRLRLERDAETRQRLLQRLDQALGGEQVVEPARAEEVGQVGSAQLAEPEADLAAQLRIEGRLICIRGCIQE